MISYKRKITYNITKVYIHLNNNHLIDAFHSEMKCIDLEKAYELFSQLIPKMNDIERQNRLSQTTCYKVISHFISNSNKTYSSK